MTIIVGVVKEKSLSADRYILDYKQINKTVSSVSRYTESKLKISPDNHFCYVFCGEQKEEIVPLVLNYLLRFEKGLVKEDEFIHCNLKSCDSLIVMSARHFYSIQLNEKQGVLEVQIRLDGAVAYPFLNNHMVAGLDLPGEVIRQALMEANLILHTDENEVDVVHQKDLILIKKATKKEIKNALLS